MQSITCIEGLQIQGIIVQDSLCLLVRGQEDLKAPVQKKTIYLICANPPTHSIRCLQDREVTKSSLGKVHATRQSSHTYSCVKWISTEIMLTDVLNRHRE